MKKLLAVIMMVTMVVSLTGCGYKVVKTDTTEVATTVVEETTTEVATTEAPTTTTTTEPTMTTCAFCGARVEQCDDNVFCNRYTCSHCRNSAYKLYSCKESDTNFEESLNGSWYKNTCYHCGHTFVSLIEVCDTGIYYATCPWCIYRNLVYSPVTPDWTALGWTYCEQNWNNF